MPGVPTCWNCGYELTGLRVDDLCPECGTPIWSQKPADASYEAAQKAQLWGVVALALFFACIGPLAVIPAIAALGHARAAERETRYGTPGGLTPPGIRVGRICAWITIVLSAGV
ncbi:MAG: hypothetical protein K8E66_09665, partial [Phycisphaerales bacterium]|nr:hypothetical protein [Phycisphaerales bacterium]